MPNGIIPTTSPLLRTDDPKEQAGSARLRLSTRLRQRALDDQIARGAKSDGDQRLALRAEQLASPRERDQVARTLERALEVAAQPAKASRSRISRAMSLPVPLRVREIRKAADDLQALVRRLRDGEPVDAQGVALTERLLYDGASPLYYDRSPVTLRHAVRSARLALEPVNVEVPADTPLAA